jgi:hypothetical protein
MTEKEWMECKEPGPMLEYLQGKASDRKFRMLAVNCCVDSVSYINQTPWLVDIFFAAAESGVTANEIESLFFRIEGLPLTSPERDVIWLTLWNCEDVEPLEMISPCMQRASDRGSTCHYLRCIFGNPFKPITLNPSWLTATVKALAEQIYNNRAFERMPVLGDALEEAGCTVAEVLEHCRNSGEHVRGCWVVDKVLGKE